MGHHVVELLVGDEAVAVLVGLNDCAVDELLQLLVGEVVADHHLHDGEEFPVRDVSVLLDVVDVEGELYLRLVVGRRCELRETDEELHKGHLAVAVCVEYVDDPPHQRVICYFRNVK
eukprot:GHVU01226912.1.p2 GENE.GHVU01226912.1~~GHVU01226912.1.p2  ORF type:complete len:117 (+),score=14.58 GHVU01226912.1:742-1092(+)